MPDTHSSENHTMDITTTLTDIESHQLRQCEKIIKSGLGTFIHVGQALATIRDNRLYREQFKTFEQYCKDVWDLSRSTAYRQIAGYEAVNLLESKNLTNLSPNGRQNSDEKIIPMTERQTRPLTKLSPEDQIRAWERVLDELNAGAKLTASLIQKAVKAVHGDTVQRAFTDAKKEVKETNLVSKQFANQAQIMMDIVSEERNNGWKTTSRREAVKIMRKIIRLIEEE